MGGHYPLASDCMDIVVKEELKAYIDPLTADEHDALERSILAEGCRDALVLWNDVLVDGHNRYGICQKHDLPFQTVQNTRFQSMDDVHLWMIEQHLGRRSVSDFQRGVLALRKRDILAERHRADQARLQQESDGEIADAAPEGDEDSPPWAPAPKVSRADMAREARLSSSQVTMIERIHTQAAPELVEAVKSGVISISAAAAVAALPEDEQRAAAVAGKDELKQAAKRVREAKRKPRKPAQDVLHSADGELEIDASREVEIADALNALGEGPAELRQRVIALTLENDALRKQLAALRANGLAEQPR
jgi:protein subunit release factor B